jgi:hypothetical protein
MSVRFEVTINGKRCATIGTPGEGVISCGLHWVKTRRVEEDLRMGLTGLGPYDSHREGDSHVCWRVPDITIGDVITIHVLGPGEYDDPDNIKPKISAQIVDPVFGELGYNVAAWNGMVNAAIAGAPVERFRVHIHADETGPTAEQRKLFTRFLKRYPRLWNQIAKSLAKCHPSLKNASDVAAHVHPTVSVDISDPAEGSLHLHYTFDIDAESHRAYFVTLRDFKVVEIVGSA